MDSYGHYPLHVSASRGNYKMVYHLLHRGVGRLMSINAYNMEGYQAIHMAALNGHHNALKVLLLAGAELDKPQFLSDKATARYTPLHCTAVSNSVQCCKVLVGRGADIFKKNSDGNTVLHVAILELAADVFEYLLDHPHYEVFDSIKNNYGETPLMLANSLLQVDDEDYSGEILKSMECRMTLKSWGLGFE